MVVRKYMTDDIKRASFQFDGSFALFRWVQEGGVNEYRQESFKGGTVDSVVNSKRPFEQYVKDRVSAILKEAAE